MLSQQYNDLCHDDAMETVSGAYVAISVASYTWALNFHLVPTFGEGCVCHCRVSNYIIAVSCRVSTIAAGPDGLPTHH